MVEAPGTAAEPLARAAPEHGGLLHDELSRLGLSPDDVLDVSVNVNPYGPCPSVLRAVAEARVDRYPDPRAEPARRALAERRSVEPGRVVVGNGAVDLLWTLARAVLAPSDTVVSIEPAFSELRIAARRVGARVVEHRTSSDHGFDLRLDELSALVDGLRPRLVYLATPANPSGTATRIETIERLAARHRDSLWIADLSFLSLSACHAEGERRLSERVVWLRSLTKDHALPGLRIGYALAPREVVRKIEAERPPWSVSSLAQAAAVATTTDAAERFVAFSREALLRDRAALVSSLSRLPVRVAPSETVFSLVDVAPRGATDLRWKLLVNHRVLVRDCSSFGLPQHVRIAARPAAERDRLLTAMTEELRR